MTIAQAKSQAIELSVQNWNTYFHVVKNSEGYGISKYWNENAVAFALKGACTDHVSTHSPLNSK